MCRDAEVPIDDVCDVVGGVSEEEGSGDGADAATATDDKFAV
jgi:hypothetical protein